MNTKHSLMTFSLLFTSITWLFLLVATSDPTTIFNNNSFAQNSATTINPLNSAAVGGGGPGAPGGIIQPVQFNNYENNQLGVSLKYPSNFLIDESKSNNTLQQISFYPTNYANISPENQILWMDVFVQMLNPNSQQQPLSPLSNDNSSFSNPSPQANFDIVAYSQNLANSIQQGNQDVTIIEGSNNTLLSGYPAYKLITKSHINNLTIDDVLISTILNNKVYSLDYQTDSSNYLDSLPTANKIIQSFKINPQTASVTIPMGVTAAGGNGNGNATLPSNENLNLKQPNANIPPPSIPLVDNLMSSLKLNNITNNSPEMLKNLKNSIENSLTNILADSKNTFNKSISNPSSIPSSASSSLSSLPSNTLEKVCSIPLVSQICSNNGIGNVGVNSTNGSGAANSGGGRGVGIGGLNTENNPNSGISVNGTNNNNNKLENQIENTLKNILGANNNPNSGISVNGTNNNINSVENTLKNILGANNNNIRGNLTEGLNNVPGLNKLTNSFSNPSSSQLSNELSSMFSNLFSSNPGGNGR